MSWDELCARISQSPCGQMFPGTSCVIGRGSLTPDVVFVGEAPGAAEDEQGIPFVGRSGQLLDRWISFLGVDDRFYIVNVLKCRPPGNRNPTSAEVSVCTPFLNEQLAFLRPRIIVCLGRFAMRFFFPSKKNILAESGKLIDNRFVILPHPSYFIRRGGTGWEEYLEPIKSILSNPE